MRTKTFIALLSTLLTVAGFGQEPEAQSSLDSLFQKQYSGEIWIVAIVAGVLILGLGIFLTMINKKVDSLEKEN